jgi:cytochrome P450
MTEPKIDDNILDPAIFPLEKGPPHRLFDLWREKDPVHWNPAISSYAPEPPAPPLTKGFWVLTRYQDVFDVSRNQELFSSYEDGFTIWDQRDQDALDQQRANFMGMPPTDHAAVKQVLLPPFSPKAMQAMAPEIDRIAKSIVDDVTSDGHCEFVFDVASKLPVYTFCELMGIPESYRERVVHCGNRLADMETRSENEVDPFVEICGICEEISEQKRQNPDNLLLSTMLHDKTLNMDQMQINMFFLVFAMAGHETTRSTAAHFIQLMSEHPDQFDLLRSDVGKYLENAIEETLRYTNTTTNFRRTATQDTEIGGYPVKKGDKVLLSYAAANRDPAVFENPHEFDITRANARKHLAFGTGPHVCIGARLARRQLYALLKEIIQRVPDVKPVGDPKWMASIWFNAITNMPVQFTPEKATG